jgi:hypothetical protein
MNEKPVIMKDPHHSARAQVPHCFYCDAVTAWFLCDCAAVQEIRAGKRVGPKVKMIEGKTVIIHDPLLMPLVEKIGRYVLYRDHLRDQRGGGEITGGAEMITQEESVIKDGVNVIVNMTAMERRRAQVAEANRQLRKRRREGK